jgi:hypothetical protein
MPHLKRSELAGLDYLLIALIMSLMGAFFWAIRGTGGFGGEQGGMLAGLGWAALWHAFSRLDGTDRRRPYGRGVALAAITFGIAFGGFTGYGVYTAWVRGQFYLDYPNGLHWGGIAGAALAWCAPRTRLGWEGWMARIAFGVAGAVVAAIVVRTYAQWFLPFYDEGIYRVDANETCIRAENSIRTIAPHVGLLLGLLAFEIARRDWRAVGLIVVMALGFAIPFSVGGIWHTMHDTALKIEWWKNWEMSIGLGGGLAFGLAFYLFNRPDPLGTPRPVTSAERLAGVGIPLILGLANVLLGTYDGFRGLHKLPWPELPDLSMLLVVGGMALVSLLWLLSKRNRSYGLPADAAPVSARVLAGIVALIIVAGYATSIPPEVAFANRVLLGLYTSYITLSAILFACLLRRRTRSC